MPESRAERRRGRAVEKRECAAAPPDLPRSCGLPFQDDIERGANLRRCDASHAVVCARRAGTGAACRAAVHDTIRAEAGIRKPYRRIGGTEERDGRAPE